MNLTPVMFDDDDFFQIMSVDGTLDFPYENPYEKKNLSTFFSLLPPPIKTDRDPTISSPVNIEKTRNENKCKVVRKDSVVFLLNGDTVYVIRRFQTFTEMLCLGYTCRHFYYILQSFLKRSFFWKTIPVMLFKELTCCRHIRKTDECLLRGLKRVDLSKTIRIEFDEELDLKKLLNGLILKVVKAAPNLKTIVIPISSLFKYNPTNGSYYHRDQRRVELKKEMFSKEITEVLISPDSTYFCRWGDKSIGEKELEIYHFIDLGLPHTNIQKCEKHKHGCFVLTDVHCSSCVEKDGKHCFRTFPYYQKCYKCEKRCCVKCFHQVHTYIGTKIAEDSKTTEEKTVESKSPETDMNNLVIFAYRRENFIFCTKCSSYSCHGCFKSEKFQLCDICKKNDCTKCMLRKCHTCEKKVCWKCYREFNHQELVSIVFCVSCCVANLKYPSSFPDSSGDSRDSYFETGRVTRMTKVFRERRSRCKSLVGGCFYVGKRFGVPDMAVAMPSPRSLDQASDDHFSFVSFASTEFPGMFDDFEEV